MRSFKNIARLIRFKRLTHPMGYSQSELSILLGYKNGQFLSNIERGLCNVPLKILKNIADILDISPEEIKSTVLMDLSETLDKHFSTFHANPKKSRHNEACGVYGNNLKS